MKRLITAEIAQAILRGEVNYAATLQDMGLVRTVKAKRMSKQARDFIERQLRNAA